MPVRRRRPGRRGRPHQPLRRGPRHRARQVHEKAGLPFIEVHMATPASLCARRDPKGLYARASEDLLTRSPGSTTPTNLQCLPI